MRNSVTRLALAAATAALLGCGDDANTLRLAGTVEIREISIAPLTSGRLLRLLRDEGNTVQTGDTIAVLTQPGLDERIAEARARAAAARARVRDLEAGARPQELENARAALDAAIADSVRAVNDFERIARLYADSVATPSQLDAARSAAETTAARVRQAREQLDLVAAGPRAHQLTAARNEAEAAAAAVEALVTERDELVLTAPADGVILLRLAEAGEPIATGSPVVILGLTRAPWVRTYVGQREIGRVRLGLPARVFVDGLPDTSFAGTVSEINPQAEFIPRAALTERERADLVYGIKIRLDDHGGRLKPGMPVTAVLDLDT